LAVSVCRQPTTGAAVQCRGEAGSLIDGWHRDERPSSTLPQRQEFARMIENVPILVSMVVRWRLIDLVQWLWEK
jgi:hypothetical protein